MRKADFAGKVTRLIDAAWYLAQYADVAAAGADPAVHYLRQGWIEGRRPNRYFDPALYGGVPDPGEDPLSHYLRAGERGGLRPSTWFDPTWYRQRHAIPFGENALAHYLANSAASSRPSPNPDFNAAWYAAKYPDAAALRPDLFAHFDDTGRAEGRLPMPEADLLRGSSLFDANHYLINGLDLLDARVDPLAHFLAQGWRENRDPNPYFAMAWYCRQAPDRLHANPLIDYILCGERSGQPPGPFFEPRWYREAYRLPEQVGALSHWLAHRTSQCVSPTPGFDVACYVALAGDRLRPGRDPFMHALVHAMQPDACFGVEKEAPIDNDLGRRPPRQPGS